MTNDEGPNHQPREAFLDIETTGLSPNDNEITVVGILLDDIYLGMVSGFDLTEQAVFNVLQGVDVVYTFNGRRFDIPFMRKKMGLDPIDGMEHVDLLYECRSVGLRGGQKVIETILCLTRGQDCVDGRTAARLGKRWLRNRDLGALDILLRYNEDDLRNLKKIKEHVERCKQTMQSNHE